MSDSVLLTMVQPFAVCTEPPHLFMLSIMRWWSFSFWSMIMALCQIKISSATWPVSHKLSAATR